MDLVDLQLVTGLVLAMEKAEGSTMLLLKVKVNNRSHFIIFALRYFSFVLCT